jgi:hypothetical protein
MRTSLLLLWGLGFGQARSLGASEIDIHAETLRETRHWEWDTSFEPPLETRIRDNAEGHQNGPPITFETEPPLDSTKTPNAKIRKTKYGPITLKPNGHVDEHVQNVPKPCGECFITAFQTEVVFQDLKKANLNEGVQLRHMVLFNVQKPDIVCQGDRYRIHASGNQREVSRLNPGNVLYGMGIENKDVFSMTYNVTNESTSQRVVYVQMVRHFQRATISVLEADQNKIYEIIERAQSNGYRNALMAWIDLTGCSAAPLPDKPGAYAIKSPSWKATVSGKILEAVGHLSDGK